MASNDPFTLLAYLRRTYGKIEAIWIFDAIKLYISGKVHIKTRVALIPYDTYMIPYLEKLDRNAWPHANALKMRTRRLDLKSYIVHGPGLLPLAIRFAYDEPTDTLYLHQPRIR
jgi:hypothetical protein